jgi:SAM-dependent methyltransferase
MSARQPAAEGFHHDPEGPPDWAPGLFLRPLEPFPGPAGRVWRIGGTRTSATISDQFKADAEHYHQRFSASDEFEARFRHAFEATGIEAPEAPLVLDLGSGSGVNSIIPCLSLFPDARLVATDLSRELLGMLAERLSGTDAEPRVACVAMDAMGDEVAAGQFDLVTGASILHHLPAPREAVEAAFRALKPGGFAIFFEPFDGHAVIRLAYERILAEADLRSEPLHPVLAQNMAWAAADIAFRVKPDRQHPDFAAMDDKWLFSRAHFEVWARAAGFEAVSFVPHNDHATLYRDAVAVNLRLATGLDPLALLPAWAVAILDGFDAAITLQMKRQNMLEGTVVLTKGS